MRNIIEAYKKFYEIISKIIYQDYYGTKGSIITSYDDLVKSDNLPPDKLVYELVEEHDIGPSEMRWLLLHDALKVFADYNQTLVSKLMEVNHDKCLSDFIEHLSSVLNVTFWGQV